MFDATADILVFKPAYTATCSCEQHSRQCYNYTDLENTQVMIITPSIGREKCLELDTSRLFTEKFFFPFYYNLERIFNPRRTCTARVTVVGLSVCVCVSTLFPALQATRWPMSDTNGFRTI